MFTFAVLLLSLIMSSSIMYEVIFPRRFISIFIVLSSRIKGFRGENLNDVWGRLPSLPSPPSGTSTPTNEVERKAQVN